MTTAPATPVRHKSSYLFATHPTLAALVIVGFLILGSTTDSDSQELVQEGKWVVLQGSGQPAHSPTGYSVGTGIQLPTGKVLVTGDNGTPTQLFDPVKARWELTGPPPHIETNGGADASTQIEGSPGSCLNCGKVLVHFLFTELWAVYDPGTGTWSTAGVANYPHEYWGGNLASLAGSPEECGDNCGRVLVAGGADVQDPYTPEEIATSAELYDPATNLWTRSEPMPGEHLQPLITRLSDGRVLVAGGGTHDDPGNTRPQVAHIFWPSRNGSPWTSGGQLVHSVSSTTGSITPLTGGRALIVDPPHVQIFDDNASWELLPEECQCGQHPASTVLPDGRILIAGGDRNGSSRVRIFNPESREWTEAAPMSNTRNGQIEAVLIKGSSVSCGGLCGSVLAVGGIGPSGTPAEVYFRAPHIDSISPQEGRTEGGESVTLRGHGLASVLGSPGKSLGGTVKFKSNAALPAAEPAQDPDTMLKLLTPSHAAETVAVVAATPGGTSNPVAFTFKDPLPSPIPTGDPGGGPAKPTLKASVDTSAQVTTNSSRPPPPGTGNFLPAQSGPTGSYGAAGGHQASFPLPPGGGAQSTVPLSVPNPVAPIASQGLFSGAQIPSLDPQVSTSLGAASASAEHSPEPALRHPMSGLEEKSIVMMYFWILSGLTLVITMCRHKPGGAYAARDHVDYGVRLECAISPAH